MNLTILGAGAWGTALAVSAATRCSTLLWGRDENQCALMRDQRVNERYLAGIALPAALHITSDFDAAVAHAHAGLVIVATPMSGLQAMLQRLHCDRAGTPGVLWLCKGLQENSGRLGHEVADALCAASQAVGVLSGPSFAIEVARGQPTALVVASANAGLCQSAVNMLHCESLRIYTSNDVVGVEVGGALKNVLAIAVGICDGLAANDGLQLGLNARAALITRGLAETTRLGLALGARVETFMGLSGLGDLVLTATGDLSRNRQVGLRLARGQALDQILRELGHVAEGVTCAAAVVQRARALSVDMPITQAMVRVLQSQLTPAQALEQLMGRSARPEHEPIGCS